MPDKNFKIKNGLEIGSPDINISGNIVSLPNTSDTVVGRDTVDTLNNKTLNNPTVRSIEEVVTTSAIAASGTINFDALTQSMLYYTSNSTGNWTLNIRGNSGVTLNDILPVGSCITVVFMATNGSTAFYQTGFQLDGTSQTLRWQGGSAPTGGSASSIDVYSFSITKLTSAPTYVVLASVAGFA